MIVIESSNYSYRQKSANLWSFCQDQVAPRPTRCIHRAFLSNFARQVSMSLPNSIVSSHTPDPISGTTVTRRPNRIKLLRHRPIYANRPCNNWPTTRTQPRPRPRRTGVGSPSDWPLIRHRLICHQRRFHYLQYYFHSPQHSGARAHDWILVSPQPNQRLRFLRHCYNRVSKIKGRQVMIDSLVTRPV